MDFLSHLLWTNLLYRNKLYREEAIYFALLPDMAFLLIMGYVLFGKPMELGWNEAMQTIPGGFLAFYHLSHSLVAFGVVAALVWRFKRDLFPAMGAWFLHICMDIPFHTGEFATRFLYPLAPSVTMQGVPWTDIRALALAYFLLALAYAYADWRDTMKHRRRVTWSPDIFDRLGHSIGGLINPKPVPVGHGSVGDNGAAPGRVPGEDARGPGEGEDSGAQSVTPPPAG